MTYSQKFKSFFWGRIFIIAKSFKIEKADFNAFTKTFETIADLGTKVMILTLFQRIVA